MNALVGLLTVVLLGAVILVVSAPLLTKRRAPDPQSVADRAELDAAREAKYREIRDAELDYRTGKLSAEDYDAIDARAARRGRRDPRSPRRARRWRGR